MNARLGIQQRVLPHYRVPFFDALAQSCRGGLSVFAGQPRPEEAIETAEQLEVARYHAGKNVHLGKGAFYFCWQSGLRAWLDAWQPDMLVVEANPRYLRTGAAVQWMHLRNRPVIGWGLGVPQGAGIFDRVRQTAWRRFLSQFDALVAYSQAGAAQYRALGFRKEGVFVAPNAATHRPHAPLPVRPAAWQIPTILFVGRLQARKRIDLLLQACANLPVELQPRLWLVGDGPARPQLEDLARRAYPQAVFHGAQRGAGLDDLLDQSDLFILPGTGGLAVQQAMGHGLPVIVARGDGTQSDLVSPQNGWVVEPDQLEALQAALQNALGDVTRLRRMGVESYRIVAEEINIEKMVAVFGEVYEYSVRR